MKGPGPRPVRAGISDGGGMHCSSTSGGLHNREPPGTHNSSAEGAWQFGRGPTRNLGWCCEPEDLLLQPPVPLSQSRARF